MIRKTALFVSPHFDDVVFSCGATVAKLVAVGVPVCLCTVFSASRLPMCAFAVNCQTSKGIPASASYLALRAEEDATAARMLHISSLARLGFLEAPYRGYESAAELFEPPKPHDTELPIALADRLRQVAVDCHARQVYFPAGNGRHVDHMLTVSAARVLSNEWKDTIPIRFYEELPYAIRCEIGQEPLSDYEQVGEFLERKLDAAACYSSQLGFQFGGPARMRRAIGDYAEEIARKGGFSGAYERFFWTPC
jgi:LmbE family N-acetylglucosaminyl deacetylase